MSTEDVNVHIVILRSLCQGMGIRENLSLVTPEILKDFGCNSKKEFVDLIDATLRDLINEMSPDSKVYAQILAAQCALALDDGDKLNLTGRREQLIVSLEVSYRTVMRYEITGMEILVRRLEFAAGDEPVSVEPGVSRMSLLRRVKRLESMLEALLEFHGMTVPE